SEVHLRALGALAGLQRVGILIGRIPPGKESFVYHSHRHEEEFLYVLAGRGIAEIGEEEVEVGPGDFMGFATPSFAHHLRNPFDVDLVYLMRGEHRAVEVAAMHITAGIWVNDEESGLKQDLVEWLDRLAPPGDYHHHQTGEDNADAHLKRTLIHHQVILPVTRGKLDLGPWEQVFYAEFDGRRKKRVVVKVIGE